MPVIGCLTRFYKKNKELNARYDYTTSKNLLKTVKNRLTNEK